MSHPPPSMLAVLRQQLLESQILLGEDLEALPPTIRERIEQCRDVELFLGLLVRHGLLTAYQASRVGSGRTFGLVLGNYRVLERIGSGGMGTVYKAEHIRLRRLVAIKVLVVEPETDLTILQRFFAEIRGVSRLQHPNIVAALDVGEVSYRTAEGSALHYFVMEYVPGRDLEEWVRQVGPLPPALACRLIAQTASALVEADKHELVHRDIKPSNIRITPEGQTKLLDFGLARHINLRLTRPGTSLGTLAYLAPEQALDASTVDIRADIYSLGATLFWCLTGKPPFSVTGTTAEELSRRVTQPAPSVLALAPDLPPELDQIVQKMLATRPVDRFQSPAEVVGALMPFAEGTAVLDAPPRYGKIMTGNGRQALTRVVGRILEARNIETPAHLNRLQRYSRCLAEAARDIAPLAGALDDTFIQLLETAAPLHDLGMAALPDHILQSAARLSSDEKVIIQTHCTQGAELLQDVVRQHDADSAFWRLVQQVVRHHHERWDGKGYPDRLQGEDIPLAARFVHLADVYDALRCKRPFRPAFNHGDAVALICSSDGHFDPRLLEVFRRCADRLERIFQESLVATAATSARAG